MAQVETQELKTGNGCLLSSTIFQPDGEAKAIVILAPAMGVTQKFYSALASWLASQGFWAVTFDYSGTGRSLTGKQKDSKATITDWATVDCQAIVDAAKKAADGKSIFWIGHSLGGQVFGWIPNTAAVNKVINIACGTGYWREGPTSLKPRAWLLWFVVVPLAVKICGNFPGKKLRMIGDVPGAAMRQWRSWCLNPEYLIGVEGTALREKYHSIATPICSLSFTDDELMSVKNIESLHGFYSSSSKTMKRISPKDIGVKRIGHFGFFREKFERTLWKEWLLPELTID